MRRLTLTVLVSVLLPALIWSGNARATAGAAPLCTLAPAFERELLQAQAVLGAAVYDLQRGTVWSGGHAGPYALHSVVKPAIAWAVISDVHEQGRELTRLQRDALFYMVAWSQNPDVGTLLGMIGGLPGLTEYYGRWGVPELVELTHASRWGASLAEPVHLARLFGALAVSEAVPEVARADGFELLRQVVEQHLWGATIPEQRLPGWESLIKTGNFTLPESEENAPTVRNMPRNRGEAALYVEEEAAGVEEEGDTPLAAQASPVRALVRMNSAAIWLAPPWQDSEPRYVVAIMQESFIGWGASRQLQNRIGAVLAEAIAQREAGQTAQPTGPCLKRALS